MPECRDDAIQNYVAPNGTVSWKYIVHASELLEGAWTKIDDLRRLNLFAHAETVALQAK
jgi:hypothetical protein